MPSNLIIHVCAYVCICARMREALIDLICLGFAFLHWTACVVKHSLLLKLHKSTSPFAVCSLQGVKFLQGQSVLGESSSEIAQWLFKGELLSKRAIGDYLGEG